MKRFIQNIVKVVFCIDSKNVRVVPNDNKDACEFSKMNSDKSSWRHLTWQEQIRIDEDYRSFHSFWDD